MEWYYSEKLKLYVALGPLRLDSKVASAARETGISLEWDDAGYIIKLDFAEAKRLSAQLGGRILTPTEYWILYNEALETGNEQLLNSLSSDEFAEFLDRVYLREGGYIDHARVLDGYRCLPAEGEEIRKEQAIVGRPGWILPEDIDPETGVPVRTHEKGKQLGLIKYWSPDFRCTKLDALFVIRGYVTSVAAISLDMGIPIDSRQPKLMLRLCTEEKPASMLSENELRARKEQECLSKGKALLESLDKTKPASAGTVSYEAFLEYIKNTSSILKQTLNDPDDARFVTLVMGHKNPDSDTVISSVFEAYRLYLDEGSESHIFLPYIQAAAMPAEIREILGEDISDALLYEGMVPIERLIKAGRFRAVYTDQNYQYDYQKYVICITDHHMRSAYLKKSMDIPCYIEETGSVSAQIAIKYLGMGLEPDAKLSKMLYSAMLMDTENRAVHKMTPIDTITMDYFRERAELNEAQVTDRELYRSLMGKLILETNPEILFGRDYKLFSGFGFAVMKTESGADLDIEPLLAKADAENDENGLFFVIIKVVYYKEAGIIVDRERIYIRYSVLADERMRAKTEELIKSIISNKYPESKIAVLNDCIEISGSDRQISRKMIAPYIESLIDIYGKYYYMDSIGKWVSRDFLKRNPSLEQAFPELQYDAEGRVCNISLNEARNVTAAVGLEMLTLKEYWLVYHEAIKRHIRPLYESMTDPDFLELLNTYSDELETGYEEAHPGLIDPDEIDPETGLPMVIHLPNEYDNKELWRYWSPSHGEKTVFSRSYIFLIGQACLDAKMLSDEGCVRIGIRPVRSKKPEVEGLNKI